MMFLRSLSVVLLLLASAATFAADLLDSAKAEGLIGEREDGYIGFVIATPPADVAELVDDVNAKRKAEYQRIARQNGLTTADVEALAGKKAMARTDAGEYIYQGGSWRRK